MPATIYFGDPTGSLGGCECASPVPLLRAVGAELLGGGDTTHVLAWIAAYDIDTVAWGEMLTGYFTDPSQTSPPSTSSGSTVGVMTGSENNLQTTNTNQSPLPAPDNPPGTSPGPCDISADSIPTAYRAQAYLPVPTAYYVIAWGGPIDAALNPNSCGLPSYWVAQGCVYPKQPDADYPMLVDLDIPDDTLDATILVQNYYIGIITPGAGYSNMNGPQFAVQQDLAGMGTAGSETNAVGMNGFGPNWNPSAVCHASIEPSNSDPFIGP